MNAVASCTGKSSFPTWAKANIRAEKMNRRKGQERHMSVYRCKVCGRYHLGHTDKNEQRVNRKARKEFFEEGKRNTQ